jgi:hypothetical protein
MELAGGFAADSSGAQPFAACVPPDSTRFEGAFGFGLVNRRGISISSAWVIDR